MSTVLPVAAEKQVKSVGGESRPGVPCLGVDFLAQVPRRGPRSFLAPERYVEVLPADGVPPPLGVEYDESFVGCHARVELVVCGVQLWAQVHRLRVPARDDRGAVYVLGPHPASPVRKEVQVAFSAMAGKGEWLPGSFRAATG